MISLPDHTDDDIQVPGPTRWTRGRVIVLIVVAIALIVIIVVHTAGLVGG